MSGNFPHNPCGRDGPTRRGRFFLVSDFLPSQIQFFYLKWYFYITKKFAGMQVLVRKSALPRLLTSLKVIVNNLIC